MEEYPYPLLVEGHWTSVNPKTLHSKLQIYFQSRKKSQGGDCAIRWSERSCSVFFKSEEIRDQVLAKAEHVISIDQQVLKLKVSKPSGDAGSHTEETLQAPATTGSDVSAGAQQAGGPDASLTEEAQGLEDAPWSNGVVLENVSEKSGKDFLTLLVDTISGHPEEEHSLELIPESNAAVVTFNDPSAVEKFLAECEMNKRFREHGLKARRLEKSRSVKVEKLPPQCIKDYLALYLEKHVGAVEEIMLIEYEQVAIVTFQDQQAVQKIFQTKHTIHQTPVDIYPYVPSLGSALYGKDRPAWTLPKPFTEEIHPSIREFLEIKGQIPVICNQMSTHFCQVNMDKDKVLFNPIPALLRQKDVTKKHIDNWKQDTMNAFKQLLSNFDVFEYAVIPSVWAAVEKDVRSVVKEKAFLNVDDLTGCLTLSGMAKDVNMLKPILIKTLHDASIQMEREKMKTSDSVVLPPAIFFLFQHEGLEQTTAAKYPQLELTYIQDSRQLSLTGIHVELLDIKNVILMRQMGLKEKTLKMDPSLLEFLGSVDSVEMSRDLFTSKKIGAVYRFENGDIFLTASTDKELTEAEKKLDMTLTLQLLPVEDPYVLKKKEWQDITTTLYEAFNLPRRTAVLIKSSEGRDTVVVCGFLEPVREVSRSLEQFLENHSRIEEAIRVKCHAVVKFIKEKKPEVWQKFPEVDKLNIHFDSKRPLIRVYGERVHVRPVLMAFHDFARGLYTDRFAIRKAGAKKYFEEQGTLVLMMIKEQRFVVALEDASMEEEDEERYNKGTVDDVGQLSCEVQTPGGIVIKVLKADMCKLKVDAVVNAANEDLMHIGGLALALLNAAGPSLQQNSNQYVAKHGKLQAGNAVTTEAGSLPCKYVVHAVGPRFHDSNKFTAVKLLRQAVRESLEQAVLKRCSSIALPAISSGIFGFPLNLCTEMIAQELRAYVDKRNHQGAINTLKEIYLADNNPTTVNAMVQAVRKEFKEFNPRMTFPQQIGQGTTHHGQKYQGRSDRNQGYQEQGAGRDRDNGARAIDYQVSKEKGAEAFEDQFLPNLRPQFRSQFRDTEMEMDRSGVLVTQSTKKGLKIILRKGNLQDARSDVIVNTVSEDLDLSKGAVSKALLNAAGPQLQAEADSYLKSSGSACLNFGDLLDTKGYNLNCHRVFHTVCPFWREESNSEKILKEIVVACLKEAEKQKTASISFPAIGTGNLRFPRDVVSRILLSEIHAFSARVSPQYLKEVTVIVHPSDSVTVQCFVKSFRGEWQGSVPKGAHAVQQSPAGRLPPVKSQQPAAGFIGAVSTPSLGVHRMQIKHLTLEVSSGDITKERCDAIVNSSNSNFSLKSGVSKAILDAAGSAVETECAMIVAKLSQQVQMIVTSGGQLPCKHIIHILGRNNPAEIKVVVNSVLKNCEEQKFSSVAFPALGTGQGRVQPSAVADAMIDALIDFVKKKKVTNLQSVKFLIFQAPMVSDFYQCMLKRQQESVEEEGGVMGWVKEKVANMTNFFLGTKAEDEENGEFVLVGEEFDPVVFQLCGESEEDLKEAKDVINSFIVKEHISNKIEDLTINHFGQKEAVVLSNLQRELTVSIQLSKSGPEPSLIIEGLTRDVVMAGNKIQEMIRKMEKTIARQRNAFKVAHQAAWRYQDRSGNVVPFDLLTNYDLEEAFLCERPQISIIIDNDPYETNLNLMIAIGKHGQITLSRTGLKGKTRFSELTK